MSDLISRQDAVMHFVKASKNYECGMFNLAEVTQELWKIASAQPEPTTEIQEILNYLDTTLHPIVSPDNWYVYAELHDMVSMLPSVQPEQRWILVTERLPNKDGLYLVTTSKGQVQVHVFSHNGNPEEYWMRCNKAWMPLPTPYTESEG